MFAFVKERMWKKAHGWKEKLLSRAGKEVLMKSVLQSIPSYVMSVFMLPITLCNRINSIMRSFWWSGDGRNGGNGSLIKVWKDRWLPQLVTF